MTAAAGSPPDTASAPTWRTADQDTFDATVLTAAAALGVQPLAVEKDYWVCEALRALLAAFPSQLVFKGGTSLEKLRLIQRFSEDLDLLVVGAEGLSNRVVKRLLEDMCDCAGHALSGIAQKVRSGGKAGAFHRSAYVEAPLTQPAPQGSALADPRRVLVELGQSGGDDPVVATAISSLLSRQLAAAKFDVTAWPDLSPFDAQILHPGRTLLEKLLRVNNFAVDDSTRDGVHGWARIGRQFYDIFAALGDASARDLLSNKERVRQLLADCAAVSAKFERPDAPVPAGGFARSGAFDGDGPLTARLRAEHDTAMRDLYYGLEPGPTFDDVLTRVHDNATLLDPGT